MLVLVPVSSMNTSRLGSSCAWVAFQSARAAATSGRSCSDACRLFFIADVPAVEEVPHRADAGADATFLERGADFFQRQIGPLLDQLRYPFGVRVQERAAMTPRFAGRYAALPSPALRPFDRAACAYRKQLRRPARRPPVLHHLDQAYAQILRIGPCHGLPSNQNRPRLAQSPSRRNPPKPFRRFSSF